MFYTTKQSIIDEVLIKFNQIYKLASNQCVDLSIIKSNDSTCSLILHVPSIKIWFFVNFGIGEGGEYCCL